MWGYLGAQLPLSYSPSTALSSDVLNPSLLHSSHPALNFTNEFANHSTLSSEMDFDLPEIDEIGLSNEPDSVPINNILEPNHHTSTISNGFVWPTNISSPLPPPCPVQLTRLANDPQQPSPEPAPATKDEELTDYPPIDKHEITRVGGIAYAEQCKERAREQCKDMRKKEHMANGNHKFVTRQKKGDKSVNDKHRYKRRLEKNQDSAHAARYAKKVYVYVLEELVKKGEEQNNALQLEVRRLREENSQLQGNGIETISNSQVVEAKNNSTSELFGYPTIKGDGRYDSLQVAKLIDMLTSPEQVSAQAQDLDFAEGRMGIQPSPAV